MSILRYLFVLSTFTFTTTNILFAKKDSAYVAKMDEIKYKNVLKWNPTPMILWSSKNLTFSYERIISPKQSITFSLGYLELPTFTSDSILNIISFTDRQKYGFNVNAEYRFYLTSRNGRPVPDGIYLAPYLSHYNYHFRNKVNSLTKIDGEGTFDGDIYALNMGAELGYQFVFKNRITLDLVLLGPSLSYYFINLKAAGSVDAEDLADMNQDFYNRLKDKFPQFGEGRNNEVHEKYRANAFSGGFRYLVQIGYRF